MSKTRGMHMCLFGELQVLGYLILFLFESVLSNFGVQHRICFFYKGSVGTLNQGYPLLRYEGVAPVRHPQVIRRAAPTTWAGIGTPRGKER
jgi:hypothetical protein